MNRTSATLLVLVLTATSQRAAAEDFSVVEPDVCTYRSDLIGHRCTPYGRWGLALESPYVFVNLGGRFRNLPARSSPHTQAAPVAAAREVTEPMSSGSPSLSTGSSSSMTGFERFGIGLLHGAYVALEAEVGPGPTRGEDPGHRSLAIGGLGLFGLRIGTRLIAIGAEIGGGARLVDTQTTYGISELSGEPVLELRARGDLWLTPWFSVGGEIGSSIITKDDWFTGLYLGFHTHSYGGRR